MVKGVPVLPRHAHVHPAKQHYRRALHCVGNPRAARQGRHHAGDTRAARRHERVEYDRRSFSSGGRAAREGTARAAPRRTARAPSAAPQLLLPIDSIIVGGKVPAMQPDALDRLIVIGNRFLTRGEHRLGRTARPNHTFYAHRVVTTAIQRIRLDLLKGASLTPAGEEFVAGAAAYLAMLAVLNWQRRGLAVSGCVARTRRATAICFAAERTRGARSGSSHISSFMHAVLLRPKSMFPRCKVFPCRSLTLPSPDILSLACTFAVAQAATTGRR